MPQRSGYAHGTPSWIDIGTDTEAAKAFYCPLFGWEGQDAGPPEETGGYGFFTRDGLMIAGYGPQQSPGPPYWSTYVAVDDADDVTKRVEAAGGNVVVPPMDVMTAGRMAVYQDPEGSFFAVWQAGEHRGAQLVNEPGALCWNELNTRDLDQAERFYREVFGWETVRSAGDMTYLEAKVGGESVAGMLPMPPMVPEQVPSHWLVYFAVADVDATVAHAQELGGSLLAGPMEVPVGRFAVLSDPQGAAFAAIRLSS